MEGPRAAEFTLLTHPQLLNDRPRSTVDWPARSTVDCQQWLRRFRPVAYLACCVLDTASGQNAYAHTVEDLNARGGEGSS